MYAAINALDGDEGVKFFLEKAKDSETSMPEVYFFIRRPISEKYSHVFRRLASQSILKSFTYLLDQNSRI